MVRKTAKVTDRFKIQTLSDGIEHEVIETTEFLHCESLTGTQVVPGLKSLETTEGFHVNITDEGGYLIVALGDRAKRV